jgi:hypothetical protein
VASPALNRLGAEAAKQVAEVAVVAEGITTVRNKASRPSPVTKGPLAKSG